ncbi:AAA family ATPase [Halobaculum rubrum]|uniref:AAA family ATPase n=1 Tax=Halobaculum rubrum TaxID=2872158 RepID=UPI001CA44C3C|nr:ATP-binding protein [Halobaculum rubrum]QZY01156.1 ATP-binding protein [Halobaculum rubrum]
MNPAADTATAILRKRFKGHREDAETAKREGRPHDAAVAYRDAADALQALASHQDVDREADVAQLREAANRIEAGRPLRSEPTVDPGGRSDGDRPTQQDPHSDDGADDEFRATAESFVSSTDAVWDDVGGLTEVVQTLKRSVALGAARDTPPALGDTKGVLLHGPPGTGKTLLAAAAAGSLGTTFFEVNTGNLLSKYFGESSKQISALFEVARELSPSIVFLDEVDALTTARGDDTDGAARRVLDSLLSELDGLESNDDSFVLPLASTNTPWDLDRAVRRRFEQRIYVPLPDRTAAEEIVRIHSTDGGVEFADESPARFLPTDAKADPQDTVSATIAAECVARGFSGHDIAVLCKEAIQATTFRANGDLATLVDAGNMEALRSLTVTTPPVPAADVRTAFTSVSASLSAAELDRFEEWHADYGTTL